MKRFVAKRGLSVLQEGLVRHVQDLGRCSSCPGMIGPVVTPPPVVSRVYLLGQAPGRHEGALGRPFAWTAGKTLFRWFSSIGLDESEFRARVYMAAVCRCFPGRTRQGGDRVPSREEVGACAGWMEREIELLRPNLVIPVGKLAIARVLGLDAPLSEVIGTQRSALLSGHACDVIALPHPSGASSWFKVEPGKALLQRALGMLAAHASFQALHRRPERTSLSRRSA
jgi:uracil-DNA glycosylase